MLRRFISYHFLFVAALGVLALYCCDFTLTCSRIRPAYFPFMRTAIAISYVLLAAFAASLFVYLQGHFFHRERTRRALLAALLLLFAAYALLLGLQLCRNLDGLRSIGDSPAQLWHRYSLAFSGTANSQLRNPSWLETVRDISAYRRQTHEGSTRPWLRIDLLTTLALILPPFLAQLFYRPWRNRLIARTGYDLDNNLDLLFAALSLPALACGAAVPWALPVAALLLAVPFARRLRPMGAGLALASTLWLPFLLLDVSYMRGLHIFSTFLAGVTITRMSPTLDHQFAGRVVQGLDRYNGEIEDEIIRGELLEAYRRRREP